MKSWVLQLQILYYLNSEQKDRSDSVDAQADLPLLSAYGINRFSQDVAYCVYVYVHVCVCTCVCVA